MLSTVLIIDKRKELSIKYKKSIDEFGVETLISRTLKDAFVSIQNYEPDIIIISDSIEENLTDFCQKVRALTYNTRPVIIALSKSADSADRIAVLESGADDFLSEPVNIDEFKTRIKAHIRRDYESNLELKTLLPNQKLLKKALKRVIKTEQQAVLYANIENLKEYKTIYTELASDKLIQTFVAITKSALSETDIIGQWSETSFVIITNKYGAEKLAEFITFAFDTVIKKFYTESDYKRGYMLMKNENHAGMRVNFVSVLIGGIIDGFNMYPSTTALIEKLIEMKKLAKISKGSNYVFDRTKLMASDSVVDVELNKQIYIREKDNSLKILLQTALELQGYEIKNEMDINSTYQPAIIIMDVENDLSGLELLKEMKRMQNFVNTRFIITTTTHNKSIILDAGADLYLPKPYEIINLINWVEYLLK